MYEYVLFQYYHGMDTQKLTTRLRAKEKLIQEKTSQLAELLKNLRKDGVSSLGSSTQSNSNQPQTLRKRYRQDDANLGIDLSPHNNVNHVTAGELTRPHGSMTSNVECSEINGRTECRRKTTKCQGWGIGCESEAFSRYAQCGNLRIFLQLIFYVKSILKILKVQNLSF